MRPLLSALLAAGLLLGPLAAGPARAQPPAEGDAGTPSSGDAAVDLWRADINRYAALYPEPFADELVRYFDAPPEWVQGLLRAGWAPGDVYYACALARGVGRPCRYVSDERSRAPAGGWAELAERLGAAPGSAAYARVRQAFAPSYARWGRPLPAAPAPPRRH